MADLVALARTANRLVSNAPGRTVTFVRLNTAKADPTKPWRGNPAARDDPETPPSHRAVFLPPSGETQFGTRRITAELVARLDSLILVAPGPEETRDLSTYDVVRDGARELKIEFADRLDPGDPSVAILYQMGLRR